MPPCHFFSKSQSQSRVQLRHPNSFSYISQSKERSKGQTKNLKCSKGKSTSQFQLSKTLNMNSLNLTPQAREAPSTYLSRHPQLDSHPNQSQFQTNKPHNNNNSLIESVPYGDAFILKQVHLTCMIKEVHTFISCITDLRWILFESYRLIGESRQRRNSNSTTGEQLQFDNIYREYEMLVRRFEELDHTKVSDSQQFYAPNLSNSIIGGKSKPFNFQPPEFNISKWANFQQYPNPTNITGLSQAKKTATTRSFKYTEAAENQENNDHSNQLQFKREPTQTDFENIQISDKSSKKLRINNERIAYLQSNILALEEQLRKQQIKIDEMLKERQQLNGYNDSLKEDLAEKDTQFHGFKAFVSKTLSKINKLPDKNGKTEELALAVQHEVENWDRGINIKQLMDDHSYYDEKNRRMQQITNLQYEISQLFQIQQSLQNKTALKMDKNVLDQYGRLLFMQANTIQQILK